MAYSADLSERSAQYASLLRPTRYLDTSRFDAIAQFVTAIIG